MRYAILAVAAVALLACRDTAAPAQSCDPRAQTHPDSMKVVTDSLGNPVLIIKWCGPITVE